MEYLPFGSLRDNHEKSPFNDLESLIICDQGLEGLDYLHSMGIAIRDIKPEDVMLSSPREQLSIKFVDFSVASNERFHETFCGNPMYVAPEVFGGEYGCEADLWSWGLIIWWLRYGLQQRPLNLDRPTPLRIKEFYTQLHRLFKTQSDAAAILLRSNLLCQDPQRRSSERTSLQLLIDQRPYEVPEAANPDTRQRPPTSLGLRRDERAISFQRSSRHVANQEGWAFPEYSQPPPDCIDPTESDDYPNFALLAQRCSSSIPDTEGRDEPQDYLFEY